MDFQVKVLLSSHPSFREKMSTGHKPDCGDLMKMVAARRNRESSVGVTVCLLTCAFLEQSLCCSLDV